MKHYPTLAINRIMTPLKLDTRGKLTLGFLFAIGCSSHVQIANDDTSGGQSAQSTGGSSANGGSSVITDGGAFTTGGNSFNTGSGGYFCCPASGGTPPFATGGTNFQYTGGTPPFATGGAHYQETGGNPPVVTGGSPGYTGGAPSVTGGAGNQEIGGYFNSTGGAPPATGGAPTAYPNPGCTFGADQTCTDDVTVSSLVGQCGADGYCTCNDPDIVNPHSGKCNTYEQTVCYSPTQNIDLAYVARAFGCHCNSTTPFCGIDSSGLRVYLVCTSGNWQSGDTSNCTS